MKNNIIHFVVMLGLVAGNLAVAQAPAPTAKVEQKSRLHSEKEIWQKGIAAAKKRHWSKQRLTRQERDYYNAVRKRVGGTVAGILALIGIGYGAKKYVEGRAAERARFMATGLAGIERAQQAEAELQAAEATIAGVVPMRPDTYQISSFKDKGGVATRRGDTVTIMSFGPEKRDKYRVSDISDHGLRRVIVELTWAPFTEIHRMNVVPDEVQKIEPDESPTGPSYLP